MDKIHAEVYVIHHENPVIFTLPPPALSGSGYRVESVHPLSLSRKYPAPLTMYFIYVFIIHGYQKMSIRESTFFYLHSIIYQGYYWYICKYISILTLFAINGIITTMFNKYFNEIWGSGDDHKAC